MWRKKAEKKELPVKCAVEKVPALRKSLEKRRLPPRTKPILNITNHIVREGFKNPNHGFVP